MLVCLASCTSAIKPSKADEAFRFFCEAGGFIFDPATEVKRPVDVYAFLFEGKGWMQ